MIKDIVSHKVICDKCNRIEGITIVTGGVPRTEHGFSKKRLSGRNYDLCVSCNMAYRAFEKQCFDEAIATNFSLSIEKINEIDDKLAGWINETAELKGGDV